jgi:hypothetical protein
MDRETRFKTLLAAGALLVLTACAAGPTASNMNAQSAAPTPPLSPFNILPNFYKVNPAEIGYKGTYKTTEPLYLLVDWDQGNATEQSYFSKGYFLLGHCDFSSENGVPLRGDAIEYGAHLGADLIIYAEQGTVGGRWEHYVAFLAKSA